VTRPNRSFHQINQPTKADLLPNHAYCATNCHKMTLLSSKRTQTRSHLCKSLAKKKKQNNYAKKTKQTKKRRGFGAVMEQKLR